MQIHPSKSVLLAASIVHGLENIPGPSETLLVFGRLLWPCCVGAEMASNWEARRRLVAYDLRVWPRDADGDFNKSNHIWKEGLWLA